MFDGPLFGHVFGLTSIMNPTFIWPKTRKYVNVGLTVAQARDIAWQGPDLVYMMLFIALLLMVFGALANLNKSYGCWKQARLLKKVGASDVVVDDKAFNRDIPSA